MPTTGDRAAEQRARRRQQILTASKELFAERGYHSASINDIIGRAGIARGTFYLYFESKHAVFDAILDESLGEMRGRIRRIEVGEGAAPPLVQLRETLKRVFDFVLGDPHFSRLLLGHGRHPDPEAAERVDALFGHVQALIARSLSLGIEMGLIRDCDTGLVSAALFGAVRGIVERVLVSDQPPSTEDVVDELIAFSSSGIVVSERWTDGA